jgi:hypothetical protein
MSELPYEWPEQPNPPPRPALHSSEVVFRASRRAAGEIIKEWWGEASKADRNHIVDALCQAFSRSIQQDGYAMACYLDRQFLWDPDANLVDILDRGHLYDAHNAAVREWVAANGITPKFAVGNEVSCRHGNGVIVSIYTVSGEYVVEIGDKKFVIAYEDVEPVSLA